MVNLDDIGLNVAPLSGDVMLIRVGKDRRLALDKRVAWTDFYRVLELLQDRDGDYSQRFMNEDDQWFEYSIKKLSASEVDEKDTATAQYVRSEDEDHE